MSAMRNSVMKQPHITSTVGNGMKSLNMVWYVNIFLGAYCNPEFSLEMTTTVLACSKDAEQPRQ